jgi:type I restriction enzyme S subunit
MATNQGFKSFVPNPARLDAKYLYHWLRKSRPYLESLGNGATFKEVSKAVVSRIEIPLPPLPEQRRIAAILAKADALRAERRAALAQLDTLTQSIFLDMFGDPASNPKGWPWKRLGCVADFFAGSTLPDGDAYAGQLDGYFLMKVSDMNLPGNETYIKSCQQWSKSGGALACTCPAASVVIPKRGGAIGTNKKRITVRSSVLDPNLMAITPKQEVLDLPFLYAWLLRLDLASITSGSSVPQLNKRDLDPLLIALPPLSLQHEFSSRFRGVERTSQLQKRAAVELDALFASLQHRAFRGEL